MPMIYELNNRDDPEQEGLNIRNVLIGIILGMIICALLTLCTSCTTTKYVTVPEYHTDTLIQTKILKDSVYLKDSTYVSEKGDTVKIEHWHTEYVKKEMHDTLYQVTHDTIPDPYPVEVINEVEKPLTWWQQTKMHVGAIVIFGLLIALFINIFIRFIRK